MTPDMSDSPELPPRLAEFRQRYRSTVVGRLYHGYAHLSFVVLASLAVIGVSLYMLHDVQPHQWMVVVYTFFGANLVEYVGHRGPMHHRLPLLGLMFHRHSLEHHQFFTEEWMTCRTPRDYKIVLFPPIMLFVYLGVVAAPIGLLLFAVDSRNVAWLYVATAMFYFLQYESLHFLYHLDESVWIAKLPVIRWLREHHRVHHTQALMTSHNFNITWPISDFVFGTLFRKSRDSKPKPPTPND